jgi:hypothetical protein
MADREQAGHPVAGIFAVLALAVGAVVVQQQKLIGARPATTTSVQQENGIREDVPARLWQDPFAAVRVHRNEARNGNGAKSKTQGGNHAPGKLFAPYEPTERLHVFIAFMNAGPYAGAEEQRRRQRYAIVSALGTAGYAPDDPDHIGFVKPELGDPSLPDLPEFVPFERFTHTGEPPESKRARAVVLYLDEDALPAWKPLAQLVRFRNQLIETKRSPQWHWSVIGPGSTAVLESMVRELAKCGKCEGLEALTDVRFLTSQATAPDRRLAPHSNGAVPAFEGRPACATLAGNSTERFFCERKLDLRRITSTDDQLAKTLARELSLRDAWTFTELGKTGQSKPMKAIVESLDKLPRVVLVSEWDTPYGRQLPIEMRDALLPGLSAEQQTQICPVPGEPATPYSGKCPILFFSYFRGLDGQLPPSAATEKPGARDRADDRESGKDQKDDRSKRTAVERPVGDGQVDYLRRLGQFIAEKNGDLRLRGKRISAVGVLGTDVYDKLLVLKAVRDALPEALRFTTDLDTELMHPDEVKHATHNLVVVSAFGLTLRDELQAGHPPFRDTYETATYLATLAAFHEENDKPVHGAWLSPRVFEIGRKTIVDLSEHVGGGGGGADDPPVCSAQRLAGCATVHPRRTLPQVPTRVSVWVSVLLVLTLFLVLLTFRQVQNGMANAWKLATRPWPNLAWASGVGLGMAVLVFVSLKDVFLNESGEPWGVTTGVSMWPTEIMRLVTWALTCLLLHKGWEDIVNSNERLTKEFLLAAPGSHQVSGFSAAGSGSEVWWKRWWNRLKKRFASWTPDEAYGSALAVREIWRRHVEPAAFGERIRLLIVPVVLYIVAIGCLFFLLGFPARPARGQTIFRVDFGVLFLCVVSFAFLLFFVIDETRRCGSLVRRLTGHDNWPPETRLKFGELLARKAPLHGYLEDWLDIGLIGRRTEMVTRLIYYPFLIMTLMLLARSAIFDNWGFPPALLIATLVGLSIAIACALHLRSEAEMARRVAIESLNRKLLIAQQEQERALEGPIRTLIGWVESYRVGAFCPFTQQAWLKALLIPIGSLSAVPILEFLFATSV